MVLQVVTGKEVGGELERRASHPNSIEARDRSQDCRGYGRVAITEGQNRKLQALVRMWTNWSPHSLLVGTGDDEATVETKS